MRPSLTILCVDDEPAVLHTLAAVLRNYGYTVLTANDADEALAMAATEAIDVALLDPSICDGKTCLRDLLLERQPTIKMIVHTGNPEIAECVGGVPILAKPVDPREIASKIVEILEGGAGDGGPPRTE